MSGRLAALLLLPLAGVLALVAVFMRMHFQPPTLPPYTLASAQSEIVLSPDALFEMVARPTAPPGGNVGAKGFLLRSGDNRPWDAPYTTDVDGTIHIGGPVDKVFKGVPAGAWDVAVAVGRPEMLPSMPADVERPREAADRAPAAFHVVHQHVMLSTK